MNTTTYDRVGRVERLINPRGAVKTLAYDAAGRNIREIDARGRVTTMAYDEVGALLSKRDARGVTVTYTHDAVGRLTLRRYPNDASVTLSYDDVGNTTLIQDGVGRWTMTYDALNRTRSIVDPLAKRLTYTFDAAGQRIEMATPAGRFTSGYDLASRLGHVRNPENERTTYSYDLAGREVKQERANASVASTVYDAAGRVTALHNKTSGGTVQNSFDYQYDAAGNRTAVTEQGGASVAWTYDAAGRLTSEIRAGGNAYANTFTYDEAGNRIVTRNNNVRTTFSYDLADQLTTSVTTGGTTTYSYDAAGNLMLQVAPANNRTTYTWNNDNRQTRVQQPGGTDLQAVYRFDGLRHQKAVGGTTTRFVFDGANYLLETDGGGTIQVAYTVEPRTYGKAISQRAGGASHYYLFDALGSVRLLNNSAQALTDIYLYDAWGVPVFEFGPTVNPFRWVGGVGYYFDSQTGLYYVRARVYSAATARWVSRERSSRGRLRRAYLYVGASPLGFIDPSGFARMVPDNPPGWDATWPRPYYPATTPHKPLRRGGKYANCACVGGVLSLPLCFHVFARSHADLRRRAIDEESTNNILSQCCITTQLVSTHFYSASVVNAANALGADYVLDTSEENEGGEANNLPAPIPGCVNVFFIRAKRYVIEAFDEDSDDEFVTTSQATSFPAGSPGHPAVAIFNSGLTSTVNLAHELGHILWGNPGHYFPHFALLEPENPNYYYIEGEYGDANKNLMMPMNPGTAFQLLEGQCDKMRQSGFLN